MSQQSSYSTLIQIYAQNVDQDANIEANPRMQILRKAVQIAAEDLGGEVTDRIVDCDGKEWGRKISAAINQNYSVIAVMMAQEKLGYRVQVKESKAGEHKNVVVSGGM